MLGSIPAVHSCEFFSFPVTSFAVELKVNAPSHVFVAFDATIVCVFCFEYAAVRDVAFAGGLLLRSCTRVLSSSSYCGQMIAAM